MSDQSTPGPKPARPAWIAAAVAFGVFFAIAVLGDVAEDKDEGAWGFFIIPMLLAWLVAGVLVAVAVTRHPRVAASRWRLLVGLVAFLLFMFIVLMTSGIWGASAHFIGRLF